MPANGPSATVASFAASKPPNILFFFAIVHRLPYTPALTMHRANRLVNNCVAEWVMRI
jgi:hypothetical protein